MSTEPRKTAGEQPADRQADGESIDDAFLQIEILYKTRCVQAPSGSNVTVREIDKKDPAGDQDDQA